MPWSSYARFKFCHFLEHFQLQIIIFLKKDIETQIIAKETHFFKELNEFWNSNE